MGRNHQHRYVVTDVESFRTGRPIGQCRTCEARKDDPTPIPEQPTAPRIDEKPCWTEDIKAEPTCRVHNAYWSRRQDYCEVLLSRHPELVKEPKP